MHAAIFRSVGWFIIAAFAFLALFVRQLGWITCLTIIACIGTGGFLLPFVLIPIRLHGRNQISLKPNYEPVHPGRDIMPEEFWDSVTKTVGQLDPLSFRVRGHFRWSNDMSGTVSYVTLFENVAQMDTATLVVVFLPAKLRSRMFSAVLIVSKFVDGTEFVTANQRVLSHLPASKNRSSLWLPDIQNAGALYRIHQKAIRELGDKRPHLDKDPVEHLEQIRKTEIARWVKLGYYKPDESGEVLSPTWKGAVLGAWNELWPIKPIRRALRKHQTNKLLRKLEE